MAYIGKAPNTAIVNQATSQSFSGNGSTTAFTLTRSVNVGEDLEVFVNNVQQEPGSGKSYTASGTTLTFDEAPPSGTNNVYVIYRGEATINPRLEHDANAALAATTGTFSNGLTVDDDGATVLTVDRASSHGDIFEVQKDGTRFGALGSEANGFYVDGEANHAGLKMFATQIAPRRNGADVDNTIDVGSATVRFKDLYLGGGAYIGGTGAANYLDDVEEGSFTATLNGGSTHPSTRVTTTGYYTKINNQVFISINFENISTASYSGSISVFGLPFACGNGALRQVFTVAFYETASFSGTGGAFGHLSSTGTEIYLLNNRSGNSWENLSHAAGSGRYLVITGTYSSA